MTSSVKPSVWYVTAGYKLPGGIEAYLLNYATELREQGFNPRIVVFEPLPVAPHRFLVALRERGIPIESLYERVSWMARVLMWITYVPWRVKRAVSGKRQAVNGKREAGIGKREAGSGRRIEESGNNGTTDERRLTRMETGDAETGSACRLPLAASLFTYWLKRLAVRELERMVDRGMPDIIHVKGRIIAEAWAALPPERTLFHVATSGHRDPSWSEPEVQLCRRFVQGCARVLAPGTLVAETFKKEFGITRSVDVVFTMAPDEFRVDPEIRQAASGKREAACVEREAASGKWREERINREGSKTDGSQIREAGLSFDKESAGSPERSSAACRIPLTTPSLLPLTACPFPLAAPRFGILCRFSREKGIPVILEALRIFRDKYGAVDFTFAGQGPLESVIREFIDNERRTSGGVRIVPVTTAVDILRELDVFVHPSSSEAMPVSIVEALMQGLPCIATPVGGIPDLIREGVEGKLVPVGDAVALADAMARFAALPAEELSAFRRRARARYEEVCRPEVVGAQVAGIYREIMGRCSTDL